MNNFASDLKTRREQARLTVRALGDLIERSPTYIVDFELRKKSNPPEPEMMRRLAKVLNWSEDEQLRSWGYELSASEAANRANPFPPSDPRWQLIVKLQRIDIKDPGADFVVKAMGQLLDLYLTEEELFVEPIGNVNSTLDVSTHTGEDSIIVNDESK
jgi:transcriptional regulator with XRE-family HTH domain